MGSLGFRVTIVAIAFAAFCAAWLSYDPRGLRLWWRLGNDVTSMQQQNAVLTAQVDRLQRRAVALRDGAQALERAARESGYVRPNEILIELK